MYNLFNDVISNVDYIALNCRMIVNFELEKIRSEGYINHFEILSRYLVDETGENHEPQSG
jgi:hypothetical protein